MGTPETVRKWIRQGRINTGVHAGVTTEESAEPKRLRRENAELEQTIEIFEAATSFFASM